jgi:cob(I)alamin adenosyltransferase
MAPLTKGYIHVYTGDGKGKTTAALGLALRALGHGLKVYMIQFMKGNIEYGEITMARKLQPHFQIRQMGRETFVDRANPDPVDIQMAREALELAKSILETQDVDILILDEINVALDFKLIDIDDVLEMIGRKPPAIELVLTGRWAPPEIVEKADLVTEMKEIAHYYRRGIESRPGIDR